MPYNVLIVDDSPATRSFIRRAMRLSGMPIDQYLEASNGEEALAVMHTERVDAVLTDLNMPVMDGEEFVRRLRDDASISSVPVIIVSTDATAHRVDTMLSLGACGYLQKPFGPEQIRNEVERVLGGVQ